MNLVARRAFHVEYLPEPKAKQQSTHKILWPGL